MEEISADVVALLEYLAPGLLAASVYFGMTAHQKPSQFERVATPASGSGFSQTTRVTSRCT
jgi:hypothetical protein